MTIEHDFPDGADRCARCGTLKEIHLRHPQNCVPQWGPGPDTTPPRPCHTGQSTGDFAADDVDVIHARLIELETDRREALNRPSEA